MVIKAVIELSRRPGDEFLDKESLSSLELTQRLKKVPPVDRYPGSIVLRVFKKGAVVCSQNETGHSAFYLPTTDDLLRLRRHQLKVSQASAQPDGNAINKLNDAIARLEGRKAALGDIGAEQDRPRVATAHLLDGATESRHAGPVRRAIARLVGRRQRQATRRSIPIDAPTDIDFHTRQAALHEGDVFGEMSCVTLAPRSATVIADSNCYVLEMSRNIFDAIHRDAGYEQWMGEVYARRALETHLLNSEFFRALNDEQRKRLCAGARLRVAQPGMILVDEGDPSDNVFIIRNGMVQVVKDANVSLKAEQIADWQALCRDLSRGADDPSPAPAAETGKPPATTKPSSSPADILAALRNQQKHAPSEADVDVTPRPETGASKHTSKGNMDVADILAAAAKAAAGNAPPGAKQAAASKHGTPPAKRSAEKKTVRVSGKQTTSEPTGDSEVAAAREKVWTMLGKDVQAIVRHVAAGPSLAHQDQATLLAKLRFLIRSREFLAAQELQNVLKTVHVQTAIRSFPKGVRGIKKDWSDLEVRLGGWAVMQAIYPASFPRRNVSRGTPLILKYLSRGECFGEIGVVKELPRSATCIAYDHPPDESGRKPSRVEFVEIPAAVFKQLLAESPQLHAAVTSLADRRLRELQQLKQSPPWEAENSILFTPAYRDAGFVQGQKLLLIDLDHCTRCGDCVQACINTHEDGNTRLFLDGPRFDRFLVPSACRECLNPACMIGCPVGSIERGDNGQIEIRDWCIGCGLCAAQCPYDSIQIHDIGIVSPARSGWWVAADSDSHAVGWQNQRTRDRQWISAPNPLLWNIDLQTEIAPCDKASAAEGPARLKPLRVQHQFSVTKRQLRDHKFFQISFLSTLGLSLEFWLNGQPLAVARDAKQKRNGGEIRIPGEMLRAGKNMIACRIGFAETEDAALGYNSVLLQLRLDPLTDVSLLPISLSGDTGSTEIDLVTHRAVVCDLCSSLPGQHPACVEMCPHEAAIRIDARITFEHLVEQGFQSALKHEARH